MFTHFRNINKAYPDTKFKKQILAPIEDKISMGFEALLREPILKNSSIIKDPNKLAEGFNRTMNEESKKNNDKVTSS